MRREDELYRATDDRHYTMDDRDPARGLILSTILGGVVMALTILAILITAWVVL